ncbi:hypothetical protein B0H14DRAFT_3422855 [Mycena olivaceomarginata]|nr:hypothetical protein B0H14DRAFT_3422855 [Mycena olivaceomarginata]
MDDALNLRDGSLFIQLPPEMRVEIYSQLFLSTRVTWEEETESPASAPSPHPTLLRSSGPVAKCASKLGVPGSTRSSSASEAPRQCSTSSPTSPSQLAPSSGTYASLAILLMVYWDGDDGEGVYFRTSQVCYDTLGMLVRHGVGWKELYFLVHDSISSGTSTIRSRSSAGRAFCRDGNGASVAIYRATSSHSCSVLLQPATRARFAQALPPSKTLLIFWSHV